MDALDQDRAYEEIDSMGDLIEEQLLQLSTYKKWVSHWHSECSDHIKAGNEIDPEYLGKQIQTCFDEIEQIKDQRR